MSDLDAALQAGLVVLAGVVGVVAGRACGAIRGRLWSVGFVVPLLLVAIVGVVRYRPWLGFVPPFAWILGGQVQYHVAAFAVACLLTSPLSRLSTVRVRALVSVFMALIVVYYTVAPVVLPVVLRAKHRALDTVIDGNGVCLQTDAYTCGPAASVTALRRLGVDATIGEVAVIAWTGPTVGTAPDILARALEARFGGDGIRAEYRTFESIRDLPRDGVTIAVVKLTFMIDHYVAVFGVDATHVAVGDPLKGLVRLPREEFGERWRHTGVVLQRELPPATDPAATPTADAPDEARPQHAPRPAGP